MNVRNIPQRPREEYLHIGCPRLHRRTRHFRSASHQLQQSASLFTVTGKTLAHISNLTAKPGGSYSGRAGLGRTFVVSRMAHHEARKPPPNWSRVCLGGVVLAPDSLVRF